MSQTRRAEFLPSALIAVLALVWTALGAPAFAAPSFPTLTGRVVDAANVLSPQVEASLTNR